MDEALSDLINYVETNTIKFFTHQVIRSNDLNVEYNLTRRGFEFYAGYNEQKNILRCQFKDSKVWSYDITKSSIEEAVIFLKKNIREYMIANSLWNWKHE